MTGTDNDTAELRAEFSAALGEGRRSDWLPAFAEVPREHFVPSFYEQNEQGQWHEVSDGDPGYLEAVYSNTALTTQLDEQGIPTSSSSDPRVMLAMLDALDAQPGHTLFELGLGTGYNAALASARLGDSNVVSVDVDPELVDVARGRLAAARYHPHVFAGDGAAGCPARAPYDRIIATASLRCIPPALLDQSHEDTVIVAPIGFGISRVVVSDGQEAVGRFLPLPAFFMPRRTPAKAPDFASLEVQRAETTAVPAADVLDRLKFPLSLALPGHNSCSWRDEQGVLTGIGLWTEDGSTTSVHVNGTLRQVGPRRLWDTVEQLAQIFGADTPLREDFGLAITPEGQRAWYGHADGPSWSLPPL